MSIERKRDPGSMPAEPAQAATKAFRLLDEQRKATRFPHEDGTDFAAIWLEPGDEIVVEVRDESLTGLGILVDDTLGLQLGGHLHVAYAGECLQAEVRHITMRPDGRYLIGLQCQRERTEDTD